jgi:hypothetical protein
VLPGEHLDTWAEWNFWRFELVIPMSSQQQSIRYWVNSNTADAATFYVAGEALQSGMGVSQHILHTSSCWSTHLVLLVMGEQHGWRDSACNAVCL